ncbi:MAG: hypothetical protein RDU89_02770 [bacterium]|nr:hypothetical protein [bacterium]
MRKEAALLRHEARLMLSWGFPGTLFLAFFILAVVLRESRTELLVVAEGIGPGAARLLAGARAVRVAEITLAPLAVIAAGHATTLDDEARAGEVVRSLPPWRPAIPLRRLAAGWAAFVLAVPVVPALAGLVTSTGFDVAPVAVAPLAPAAFLTGLVLAAATLLRSYPAGVAAAMAVWASDLLRPGVLTGPLYLFQRGNPMEGVDLVANRLALGLAGAALAAFALWLYGRQGQ